MNEPSRSAPPRRGDRRAARRGRAPGTRRRPAPPRRRSPALAVAAAVLGTVTFAGTLAGLTALLDGHGRRTPVAGGECAGCTTPVAPAGATAAEQQTFVPHPSPGTARSGAPGGKHGAERAAPVTRPPGGERSLPPSRTPTPKARGRVAVAFAARPGGGTYTITNRGGATLPRWRLSFTLPRGGLFPFGPGGDGRTYRASGGPLAPGESATVRFTYLGRPPTPTNCRVNGSPC